MEVTLRKLVETDASNLVKYGNNKKIARNLTDSFPSPYTEEAAHKFINFASTADKAQIRAIDKDGELIGIVGLYIQDDIMCKNAELGYWVAEPFWGQGIATKAIKQAIDMGFKNLDIVRIFARPYGSNKASQRVIEKLGFTKEAHIKQNLYKWGEWEDELIYGLRRED